MPGVQEPVRWHEVGSGLIEGTNNVTLPAATYVSQRIDTRDWAGVAFQWTKTLADTAVVGSIDFYGTLANKESGLLQLEYQDDDPTAAAQPWAQLVGFGFAALPGNPAGKSGILERTDHCMSLIVLRMVVTTQITGFNLLYCARR